MEDIKNLTQDDVLEVIQDFPLEPRGKEVIITINVDEIEEDELQLSTNSFSEIQYVLAVGNYVSDLKPGQKVVLNLEAMTIPEGREGAGHIKINPIDVEGRTFARVNDNYIIMKDNRQ